MSLETQLLGDLLPQNSMKSETVLLPTLIMPSQVSGDGTSFHPQAAAPAAGTSVVGVEAGRAEA